MTVVHADESHDRYCGAVTRSDTSCLRPAGWGTPHPGIGACKLHGGCMPNHIKHAEKVQLAVVAEQYGLPREIDPTAALLEELHRTAGMITFYELAVIDDRAVSRETMLGEQPSFAVRQLMIERQHFAKLAADCVRLGLEERRVQMIERDARAVAQAIRGILGDLGVADDPRTPEVVRRHLALAAGS